MAVVKKVIETRLCFGKDATVEHIREALQKTPAVDNLQFDECRCVDDKSILQFVHFINRKLCSFEACKLYRLSNFAVELIAQRCKELQHVKFIGCVNLGQKSIESLGRHCKKLQSIAFIYEDGTEWPLVDDVLSVLVANFTSELLRAAFVGFKGITDIGINYVAECFYESLNAIDFSACTGVTDNSLIGLATNCRLLRSVAFNQTCITDRGLKALVDKCTNLQYVDVGNCQLTDQGIKHLADHCLLLEYINVENCQQVKDGSLHILTLHCNLLTTANFKNTGITKIPVSILRLGKLRFLDVRMCKELSFPPPEIIDKDVDGIADFYRERNLGYRLRVMFVGHQGSGKSSLVQSLITDTAKTVDAPTDGLDVQLWNPFNGTTHELLLERALTAEEKTLGLDMWDTSGRMVFQHCFQLVMSQSMLYVIVCDLTDTQSCDNVINFVNIIQMKAPGSKLIIVGTRLDKLHLDEKRSAVCEGILKRVKENEDKQMKNINAEIDRLKQLGSLEERGINEMILKLQVLLKNRPRISKTVIPVSCFTAQGLDDIRKEILLRALNTKKFPHLASSFQVPTTDVFNDILEFRKDGMVVMSWQRYRELMLKDGRLERDELLEPETRFLQQVGGILKFEFPQSMKDNQDNNNAKMPTICIFPEALVGMLCSIHMDDDNKAFKFESSRFWPKASITKKPHPSVVVRALEEIPSQGLIRQSLLPLLWQKYQLNQDQVTELLQLFEHLGFLVARRTERPTADLGELYLPKFPNLSTQKQYYLPLLKLLPDSEPKLNWTPKPFRGDLQIGVRYECSNPVSDALIARLIAYCRRQTRQTESYHHYWKHGVLLKIGQVHVNIVEEKSDLAQSLSLQGRVTVDEEGEEQASQVIWVILSRFLCVVETYLAEWEGLFTRVYIQACPYYFVDEDDLDSIVEVPLLDCLHALDSGLTRLTRNNGTKQYELLLDHLLPLTGDKTKDIITWYQWMSCQNSLLSDDASINATMSVSDGDQLMPSQQTAQKHSANNLTARIDKPTKRKGDIKWDVEEDRRKISEEDENKEANRVAAAFVAAVLAGATAQYLSEQYGRNDKEQSYEVTAARQTAVQASASAAKAAQRGDPEGAAKAVADAAKAVDKVVGNSDKKLLKNGDATTVKSSKMCHLL